MLRSILFGNDGADLVCLNAADGKVIWQQKGGDRVNSAPSIAGGLAYFSGDAEASSGSSNAVHSPA